MCARSLERQTRVANPMFWMQYLGNPGSSEDTLSVKQNHEEFLKVEQWTPSSILLTKDFVRHRAYKSDQA